MGVDKKKSLIDFTDEELLEAYRSSIKKLSGRPPIIEKRCFGELRKGAPQHIIDGHR